MESCDSAEGPKQLSKNSGLWGVRGEEGIVSRFELGIGMGDEEDQMTWFIPQTVIKAEFVD